MTPGHHDNETIESGWAERLRLDHALFATSTHALNVIFVNEWGCLIDSFGVPYENQTRVAAVKEKRASYDVKAEFSKLLGAGEESIFSLGTEKNLPGASYELPEVAARTKNSQK